MSNNIKVFVRVRPQIARETSSSCLSVQTDAKSLLVSSTANSSDTSREFTYDGVFDPTTQQQQVFQAVGQDLTMDCLEGFNTTIFAYGQTGSGKSYSMMGYGEDKGIIPRAVAKIFDRISDTADATTTYHVECSMLEIYNEQIRDLFSSVPRNKMAKGGLKVRDSAATGPFVMGLTKNA